jgi:hypothetical protein
MIVQTTAYTLIQQQQQQQQQQQHQQFCDAVNGNVYFLQDMVNMTMKLCYNFNM